MLDGRRDSGRRTAAWALAELGDAAAVPALEAASRVDESNEIRSRAREALCVLRGEV